jgi:hypothetical protein
MKSRKRLRRGKRSGHATAPNAAVGGNSSLLVSIAVHRKTVTPTIATPAKHFQTERAIGAENSRPFPSIQTVRLSNPADSAGGATTMAFLRRDKKRHSERYYFDGDATKERASSQDLLSMRSEPSSDFFLQEQTAGRRSSGQVREMYGVSSEDLGSEIQSDCQSSCDRSTVLLFEEGPSQEDSVSAVLRDDRRATREVSGCESLPRKGSQVQSSNGSVLRDSQGKGDEGEKRQSIPIDREGPVLKEQSRDQEKAPIRLR